MKHFMNTQSCSHLVYNILKLSAQANPVKKKKNQQHTQKLVYIIIKIKLYN